MGNFYKRLDEETQNKMNEQLEKFVEDIISPVYVVGGAVRDELMGRTPADYDFATPLSPDEIEQSIRNYGRRPYITGKRFGTVGVRFEGNVVEITTFREEVYTRGNRKPHVGFLDNITADLGRRDFTINAIARRGKRIIDPYGGVEDIKNKTIRAVGHPNHRFRDDPLRLLRAARFVSQLGFTVEEGTKKSAGKMAHKMLGVSKERWSQEMDKLLIGEHVGKGLDFLADTRILNFILPELSLQVGYDQNSKYHDFTLWEHTKKVVEAVQKDKVIRWAALLHDVGKPFTRTDKEDRSNYIHHERVGAEMVWKIARYLRWSNERRDEVVDLVLHHLDKGSELKKADDAHKKNKI